MKRDVSAWTAKGFHFSEWSNGPGYSYAPHAHPYDKVIFVVHGEIQFDLAGHAARVLQAGDHLEIPAQTRHSARAGADGVTCLEGQRHPRIL